MKRKYRLKRAFLSAFILLLFAVFPLYTENAVKAGDIVISLDFNKKADRDLWSRKPFAQWEKDSSLDQTVLFVNVPAERAGNANMIDMELDLSPYSGTKLGFKCLARAEKATKPPQPYLGVKYMLYINSESGQSWINQNDVYGTFDWKELSFAVTIPEGLFDARLSLGLQGSSGKVWFTGISAFVIRPKRPPPTKINKDKPVYKGHNLPRLRGVMSPTLFREEDIRVLGREWKANLIRWQLVRAWGKPDTDRDLTEYDQWIDRKCGELEKTLEACRKYGIKLVIDLHSPPGGRYEDNNMAMFYEKKYNDHFIRTWEKLAGKFKGHPALWAYDLVNEPVQNRLSPKGMDFWATQERTARAVRKIDPETAIIIEADEWDSPLSFGNLFPVDVPNVIYEAHMYVPGEFTHQGVYNRKTGIRYPGKINNIFYNKETLTKVLQPVRDFQLAYHVHIYIGEFSAIRWAPGAAAYLRDCIEIFEVYDWDWSYHAFREWSGWSVEYENTETDKKAVKKTDRGNVLFSWFAKNKKP
ncbi:MAG: cellulase family glycosylhydrolase [Spirochaetales bacterium]|nr:cellulase family glycosylhydrolase [Spirochaetales bacterium]